MPSAVDPLEQDEFLTVPPLFKYGPPILLLAGLVFAFLAIAAGFWRIHDGRRTEYERTFDVAANTAAAAHEHVAQLLGLLGRVTMQLDAIEGAPGQRDQITGLLHGSASMGVALSAEREVLASTDDSAVTAALAVAAASDPRVVVLARGSRVLLPAVASSADGERLVPVVQRLARPGLVEQVVFFLGERQLSGIVRKAFADEGGWLHIDDETGHEVLDLLVASTRPGAVGKPHDRLATPDEALRGPLDYDSQRLLVATAAATAGEPTVSVGLTEAASMVGVHKRIVSTWVIVGFVLPVLGSLGFTSLALRRFSKVEAYLRRLARSDALTGLPNRRRFQKLLARAVVRSRRRSQTLALLFVDIDNFKYVNDSLGHTSGDALLSHVGQVLMEVAGASNVVCRFGGDEYTVLVENVENVDAARQLGARILERLKQVAVIDGVELRTKASIGIALMPQDAQNGEDLMRFADTAMYRAKNEGKDRCLAYDGSMAAQALEKAQTVQELEHAIFAGELFLVYQPKFELRSGVLVGHEALVRWNHPVRGIVYPGDFIGLAEESGLILELGNWVLERAVRQIREWHDAGHGWFRVAVNVSALQMRHDDFVDRVETALLRHRVDGAFLQLEITESSLAVDIDQVRSMLRALRSLGVRVAVDDFGTGYSSLGALQQFELDMLKVDRSFVARIHTPQGEEICRAIVTLGHALGMGVIGEGVETFEQATALASLGCDQAQGFYFARPLAAELACVTQPVQGTRLRLVG